MDQGRGHGSRGMDVGCRHPEVGDGIDGGLECHCCWLW